MASVTLSTTILFTVAALLVIHAYGATKEAPAPAEVAPGPTPDTLSLTAILEKGAEFTTFLRMLKETQIIVQIESQLNNSFVGLTVFAPTDNAFESLKAGTLNGLTSQQQVALLLYHVLPRYYSQTKIKTASNPVTTQATGSDGPFTLNITSSSGGVNISTGINHVPISQALYTYFPLAVYQIDSVLLPYDLFGPKKKHVVAAKPPALSPNATGKSPSATSEGSQDQTSSSGTGAGIVRWLVGTGLAIGMVGLL